MLPVDPPSHRHISALCCASGQKLQTMLWGPTVLNSSEDAFIFSPHGTTGGRGHGRHQLSAPGPVRLTDCLSCRLRSPRPHPVGPAGEEEGLDDSAVTTLSRLLGHLHLRVPSAVARARRHSSHQSNIPSSLHKFLSEYQRAQHCPERGVRGASPATEFVSRTEDRDLQYRKRRRFAYMYCPQGICVVPVPSWWHMPTFSVHEGKSRG